MSRLMATHPRGSFVLQGDAEKMKTLITEDKVRLEQKYQSPEVLPSFHNFLVLSNSEKAVQVPNEERRFFMLHAERVMHGNTAAQNRQWWAHAWSLVKDPAFQALFYHYLATYDTSSVHKGQAPLTKYKTEIQAQQAPEAIKFLKDLLIDGQIMQKPMQDMKDDDLMQLRDEFNSRGRFAIKSRPTCNNNAFEHLIGDEWEKAMLKKDYERHSSVKEAIPQKHVIRCIIDHFRGESFVKVTGEDVASAFAKLGIKTGALKIPLNGSTKRCFIFPSAHGIRYLLKSQNWLSAEDELQGECD